MSTILLSFKARFVNPLRVGLGLSEWDEFPPANGISKRQTIRAERKDLRRPGVGGLIHLFYGLRTKHARRIASAQAARVTAVRDIEIIFDIDRIRLFGPTETIGTWPTLCGFARDDGFSDWKEMCDFWAKEHPGVNHFKGFITTWEPRT
jgi:hypothetical protein